LEFPETWEKADLEKWVEWCMENMPNEHWGFDLQDPDLNKMAFRYEEDALAFKLRFGFVNGI
jgi:hypothetical protein